MIHLTVADTTLHLTDKELAMIGQAISRWAHCHFEWIRQLQTELKQHGAI